MKNQKDEIIEEYRRERQEIRTSIAELEYRERRLFKVMLDRLSSFDSEDSHKAHLYSECCGALD